MTIRITEDGFDFAGRARQPAVDETARLREQLDRCNAERARLAEELAIANARLSWAGGISWATTAAVQEAAAAAAAKHGVQRTPAHPGMSDAARLAILVEEVGEVSRALTYDQDRGRLRGELLQAAAMAGMWVDGLAAQAPLGERTREGILASARARHDQTCACDPRYVMSCGTMAAAILEAGAGAL